MTKQALVEHLALTADISKATADRVLEALADYVHTALKQGDEVTLPGLGKFGVSERSARTGRNPATGETMQIAAKRVAKFSAVKALRDALA